MLNSPNLKKMSENTFKTEKIKSRIKRKRPISRNFLYSFLWSQIKCHIFFIYKNNPNCGQDDCCANIQHSLTKSILVIHIWKPIYRLSNPVFSLFLPAVVLSSFFTFSSSFFLRLDFTFSISLSADEDDEEEDVEPEESPESLSESEDALDDESSLTTFFLDFSIGRKRHN